MIPNSGIFGFSTSEFKFVVHDFNHLFGWDSSRSCVSFLNSPRKSCCFDFSNSVFLIWNLCNWPIICDSVKNMTKFSAHIILWQDLSKSYVLATIFNNQKWIFLDSNEAVEPAIKIKFLQEGSEITNCCSIILQQSRTNWTPLVVTKLFLSCKTLFIHIFWVPKWTKLSAELKKANGKDKLDIFPKTIWGHFFPPTFLSLAKTLKWKIRVPKQQSNTETKNLPEY